jgi:hypothetical protein
MLYIYMSSIVGLLFVMCVSGVRFGKGLMVSSCDWLTCGWTILGIDRDGLKLIVQVKEGRGRFELGQGFLL